MKRVVNILFSLVIMSTITFMVACNSLSEKVVPTPNKIVIYFDNNSKEINSEDSSFQKIVDLTNKRIDVSKVSTVKDIVNEEYLNTLKKEKLSIEFIYDKEQRMSFKGDGFEPMSYYKLFFPLVTKDGKIDKNSITSCFQYSYRENYTDSSRGPLKNSPELIRLIEEKIK